MSDSRDSDHLWLDYANSEGVPCYGLLASVPVSLTIGTTRPLPERHVALKREPDQTLADGMLHSVERMFTLENLLSVDWLGKDGRWSRIHYRATVQPEWVSFAGLRQYEVLKY